MIAQEIGRPVVFLQERQWFFKTGWFIHLTEEKSLGDQRPSEGA